MKGICGGGDRLARGAIKADFPSIGVGMSQKKWNRMFGKKKPELKAVYLFECPIHGIFKSTREFYLSGGYPQGPDILRTCKCPREINDFYCYEVSKYAGFQTVQQPGSDADSEEARDAGTGSTAAIAGLEPVAQ